MNGSMASSWFARMGMRMRSRGFLYPIAVLALGQLLSLLVTATGLTSSILARKGINAPTSQSFCNYILITMVYGTLFLTSKKVPKVRWYYYLLLALIDVEANYVVVKAYQYTSLTSVMLLDCWTIPCVLVLTWAFLKTKYKLGQFIGACICILGLVLVILSDVHASDRSGGNAPILGDALVIIGSMLYAVSNVTEEYLIKNVEFIELMAFLGFFGALISACQVFILERNELASITWSANAILPYIGYALSLFLFYTYVPLLLKMSGSALFNLSLLTSDMWAIVIRVFAYHQTVDWLYYIAFTTVAVGLVIYTICGKESKDSISRLESSVPKDYTACKSTEMPIDEEASEGDALVISHAEEN